MHLKNPVSSGSTAHSVVPPHETLHYFMQVTYAFRQGMLERAATAVYTAEVAGCPRSDPVSPQTQALKIKKFSNFKAV